MSLHLFGLKIVISEFVGTKFVICSIVIFFITILRLENTFLVISIYLVFIFKDKFSSCSGFEILSLATRAGALPPKPPRWIIRLS